jgi:uncharacterized membrane protein (UPF0127 family)
MWEWETLEPPRRFRDLPRQEVLSYTVPVATTRAARLLGLAFLDRMEVEEGLFVPNCRSVHTFGMRFELDLLFLDEHESVVELRRSVPPWRLVRCGTAHSVLELPSP